MKTERLKNKNNIDKLLIWLYDEEQKANKSRKEFDKNGAREMGGIEFGKECAYLDARRKVLEIFKIKALAKEKEDTPEPSEQPNP